MNYEGYGSSLFTLAARGPGAPGGSASNKTGFRQTIGVKHAILSLYVAPTPAPIGSIIQLNVYVAQPGIVPVVATSEALLYQFDALALAAAGLYPFGIVPGGFNGNIPFKAGPWPTHWEVEVVEAAASNITWSLEAQWID